MSTTKDIAIVIPFRFDSSERMDNLITVVSYLEASSYKVIVLEADKTWHVDSTQFHQDTTYIFRADHEEVFHRTKYINQLLHSVKTKLVGVWDSDVLVPTEQIRQAHDMISDLDATIVYPFNGEFIELSPAISDDIRKNRDFSTLPQVKCKPIMERPSCGGAFIVNREKYLSIGGENERFVGWGPEDAERLHRCRILGNKAFWIPEGKLYHLYHPRSTKSVDKYNDKLTNMREEFVKECSMDAAQLRAYLNICPLSNPDK